jgi:hypothetical protein
MVLWENRMLDMTDDEKIISRRASSWSAALAQLPGFPAAPQVPVIEAPAGATRAVSKWAAAEDEEDDTER